MYLPRYREEPSIGTCEESRVLRKLTELNVNKYASTITSFHVILGTLRFATIDGWTRVARCLGDWIEYGALWRVVARKLKLSCYTTNYVLREIAAVEFTLKMSFQKVRDELIYCFADGILDEEEFVLLYDAYKSTNSIYPY